MQTNLSSPSQRRACHQWIAFFRSWRAKIIVFLLLGSCLHAEDFLTGQLANGLTYYIHRNPNSKKHIKLDLVVKVGSVDEEVSERGYSHLLEHVIVSEIKFKGVKLIDERCPLWDLSMPRPMTYTAYEFTQFHLDISHAIPEGLEAGLLALADIPNIVFNEKRLEEEKKEILEEILEFENSVSQSWENTRIEFEYPLYEDKTPKGNTDVVSQVTLDQLLSFYKKWYQPNRIAIIIVGNVDLAQTKELIERLFNKCSNTIDTIEKKRPIDDTCSSFSYFHSYFPQTQISLSRLLSHMTARESLIYSLGLRLLRSHLEEAIVKGACFSQPKLETLTYPSVSRLIVTLPKNTYWQGILDLKRALDSFFQSQFNDFLILQYQSWNELKAEVRESITQVSPDTFNQILESYYRDHFVKGGCDLKTYLPLEREKILDTIELSDVWEGITQWNGFSKVALGTSSFEVMEDISPILAPCLLRHNMNDLKSIPGAQE